jgi:hypothetical protein
MQPLDSIWKVNALNLAPSFAIVEATVKMRHGRSLLARPERLFRVLDAILCCLGTGRACIRRSYQINQISEVFRMVWCLYLTSSRRLEEWRCHPPPGQRNLGGLIRVKIYDGAGNEVKDRIIDFLNYDVNRRASHGESNYASCTWTFQSLAIKKWVSLCSSHRRV